MVCDIVYQVDITKLIEPEVVGGSGDSREIVCLESIITQSYCRTQPRQNPAIRCIFTATQLRDRIELEMSTPVTRPSCFQNALFFLNVRIHQVIIPSFVYFSCSSLSYLTWALSQGTNASPRVLMANFTAFHSLLQKCLYPRILFTSRLISLPERDDKRGNKTIFYLSLITIS